MQILNLAQQSNTEIAYRKIKFPDGQQSIFVLSYVKRDNEVVIKSRLNSFEDLELIICATQCLRELGVKDISLNIPYFLGGRSDRKFGYGGINYIKNVISPIINSQGYSEVSVLDPHSDVIEACINNFSYQDNTELVKFALTNIDNKNGAKERTMFISPDAGAVKKIYNLAKILQTVNVATASKVRDVGTGNIVKTDLPKINWDGIEQVVIVDDICDGGRTFVELAKEIKEQYDGKIYLIVSHGIFSNGFYELSNYIDRIFTTNSIKNIDISLYSDKIYDRNYVSQLNVF